MENIFAIILLASLLLFVIGVFSPNTSLFWYKQEITKKKSATIYGLLFVASFILFGITADDTKTDNTSESNVETNSSPALTQAQKDSIAKAEKLSEIEERTKQTMTAIDLTQNYIDNEVRADEDFKGKKFYVEGTVNDIKKDIMGDIYVTLEGSEMFREVQCYFDDTETASKLEKGMTVTFFGQCDGLMLNVLMKNCKLVENLTELENQIK